MNSRNFNNTWKWVPHESYQTEAISGCLVFRFNPLPLEHYDISLNGDIEFRTYIFYYFVRVFSNKIVKGIKYIYKSTALTSSNFKPKNLFMKLSKQFLCFVLLASSFTLSITSCQKKVQEFIFKPWRANYCY